MRTEETRCCADAIPAETLYCICQNSRCSLPQCHLCHASDQSVRSSQHNIKDSSPIKRTPRKNRVQQTDRLAHIHRSSSHVCVCGCTFKSANMLIRSLHTARAYLCHHFSPQIKTMHICHSSDCLFTFRAPFNTHTISIQ